MSDFINRQGAIEKLRKHKSLFCKNRIEYSVLSKDEKARVDEIDNCIAELVNMSSAEPVRTAKVKYIVYAYGELDEGLCGNCNGDVNGLYDYCPYCGAKLDWSGNE